MKSDTYNTTIESATEVPKMDEVTSNYVREVQDSERLAKRALAAVRKRLAAVESENAALRGQLAIRAAESSYEIPMAGDPGRVQRVT